MDIVFQFVKCKVLEFLQFLWVYMFCQRVFSGSL